MRVGLNPIISAAFLMASGALSPTGAAAQDARYSSAAMAKQIAILGVPSKLQAVAMLQSPEKELELTRLPNGEARATLFSSSAKPEGSTFQPDIFGSTALKIQRTPLDTQWRRVLAAGPAAGRWTRVLHRVGAQDRGARIQAVNSWVNAQLDFREDRQTWGTEDRWSTLSESLARGRGDCEDYAIAKLQMLRAAGIASDDLYLTIVKDLVHRADHAVLVVRLDGKFLVLDNATDRILESQDVRDYRPIFTYSARGTWIHGYRRQVEFAALGEVPVPATVR